MKLRGRAWKFGDDIDTDAILPAKYLNLADPGELARHCMEGADPEFVAKIQPGDLIVAGDNFGCGSSREHAPIAIKHAGLAGVIAASFARIFYRNAFNMGLPIVECPEAAEGIGQGDEVELDLETGLIINHSKGATYRARPTPEFMQRLLQAGGLIPYLQQKMREEN
jgi:3-isopropylmalate dehydratase small subunit